MLKRLSVSLALVLALMLSLSAAPAFSAESVDVFIHVENQSSKTVGIGISPMSYTSWDAEKVLPPDQKVDFKHTETLTAGGATVSYVLFVSETSGGASCELAFRFDHSASSQLILGEPEFRNCQFASYITRTTHREGNTIKATIVID